MRQYESMKRFRRPLVVAIAVALGLTGLARSDSDPTMTSSSYSVAESQIGATGDFNSSSASYTSVPGVDDSGTSLGDTFAGNSASANYQTNAGFNTTAQPGLTFSVDSSSIDLGLLTATAKSTATVAFHVRNYTTYGYVVSILGSPPTNSGHALSPLTTDTASAVGQEQFGVNTVLNTSAAVGADPVQNPTGFGFGVAGDGTTGTYGTTRPYTISDKWRFNSGETVASAPRSSGNTDYTMTFMANISNTTPGGQYTGGLTLVATGTY